MNDEDVDALARTVFGEARGECLSGQEAVASVILNRVAFSGRRGGYWWGNTVYEVCHKPWQFSCWNQNDPNRRLLEQNLEHDLNFAICRRIALRARAGMLVDNTAGATHYHVKQLRPGWSVGKIPCAEIGSHVFYNDIEK